MYILQTILVIITFLLAVGYLVKKFLWPSIAGVKKSSIGTLDGGKTKCGNDDCGCH